MAYDHPPVTPMPYMTAWWQKYRHVSGLVTETIAPNRQNVPAMAMSVFKPYKLKAAARTMTPLVCTVAYYKLVLNQLTELNDMEHRRHWD